MNALLLPGVLAAWLAGCWWSAHRIGNHFFDRELRLELKALIFCALAPLVLVDEMFGHVQFDELCRDRAVLTIDAAQPQGRTVYLAALPPEPVFGLMLPVQAQRWLYIDVDTREAVLSFSTLRVQGGKLVRTTGGPHLSEPLTFDGRCGPVDRQSVLTLLNLHLVTVQVDSGRASPSPSP